MIIKLPINYSSISMQIFTTSISNQYAQKGSQRGWNNILKVTYYVSGGMLNPTHSEVYKTARQSRLPQYMSVH